MSLRDAKNYTPHDCTLVLPGTTYNIPSGGTCRARSNQGCAYSWDPDTGAVYEMHGWAGKDFPYVVVTTPPRYVGLDWIPAEPNLGAAVIVSIVAAPAVAEQRPDLTVYVPDTGPGSAVRDDDGRIRGVKRMILWHDPKAADRLCVALPIDPNWSEGMQVLGCYPVTLQGLRDAVREGRNFQRDPERDGPVLWLDSLGWVALYQSDGDFRTVKAIQAEIAERGTVLEAEA